MIPRRLAALVAASALLLAACTTTPADDGASAGPGTPAPRAPTGVIQVAGTSTIDELEPAPRSRLPVTVPSADGVDVTVTDTSRILAVDMYGTLAETVFALGLGDQVVGRDASTGFEEAAHLPLVTVGGHTLSAEAVLDLDPTVVLTDTTIGPSEVQRQLRDAGIPVVYFDPARTLDGIGPQIEAVAATLGVPDAGRELATRTTAEVDALRTAGDDGPSVAFLYLRGTAVSLMGGPGSGADELLTAVGAQDAGTAVGLERPFTPITSEALVAAAPDVLLLMAGGLESVGGPDGLLRVPGVAQTPAGSAGRVLAVEDTQLLSFGPRTPEVLRSLADALATVTAT